MKTLKICNPFNAPVYHLEKVTSTMDISRKLAAEGAPQGSVIIADFQEKGRGRGWERSWKMEEQKGLSFTLLLRFPRIENILPALTLRTGLAVSRAVEDFLPVLQGKVLVKWPNDIIIGSKKTAGILCEADGGNVHIGIGINVVQSDFPDGLREKATSIALAANQNITPPQRFTFLEKILLHLYCELENPQENDWLFCLEQRLYKKGEQVIFIEGAATGNEIPQNKTIQGILTGIGPGGELLITPNGELSPQSFLTGELK